MKRRPILDIALWALVVAQLVFIFVMSAMDAQQSKETSMDVAIVVAQVATPGFRQLAPAAQIEIAEKYHDLTRKLAHFAEYAVLGGLLTLALRRMRGMRGAMLALGIAAAYAALDEVHQIFVSGRGAQFTDVFIDSAGALIGAVAALALLRLVRNRRSART